MSIPYEYLPLSRDTHTRIIELQPAQSTSEPLYCTIMEAELAKNLDYSAISYTWGMPDFTEELIVDQRFLLRVTRNLRDALLRFRLKDEPRRLWIDAICINQKDDAEKSKQVAFMSSIYRTASSVLVWLGDFPDAARSLKALKTLSQTSHEARLNDKIQFDTDVLGHLRTLSDLPWFGRRWVIQELVLSPEPVLYCSSENLSWMRLVSLVTHVDEVPQQFKGIQLMIALWRQWMFGDQTGDLPGLQLLQLLSDFDNYQCADGRDRIYALAGLSSEARLRSRDDFSGQIDYSLSTETVYTWYAEAVWCNNISTQNMLLWDNLCARSGAYQGDLGYPWWVPDWRRPKLRVPFSTFVQAMYSCFRVVENNLQHLFHRRHAGYIDLANGRDHDPLVKSGLNLVIIETWDALPAAAQPSNTAQWLKTTCNGFVEHALKADPQVKTTADLQCSFITHIFHCIKRTREPDGTRLIPVGSPPSATETEKQECLDTFLGILNKPGDLFLPGEVQVLSRVAHLLSNRRAFSWSFVKGIPAYGNASVFGLGLGPDHVCRGDLIVHRENYNYLSGSMDMDYFYRENISIVARQLVGGRLQLVGDCYLGYEVLHPFRARVRANTEKSSP